MKNCTILIVVTCIAIFSFNKKGFCQIDPDKILQKNKKVPKVLLVGSWHFDYPGLDANVTKEKDRINIYSEERQKELAKLINYIAAFKPTKIMLESGAITGYLTHNLKEWKAGKAKLYASERSQIGIRLMDKLKLDTVYGVDDGALLMDLLYDTSFKSTPYIDFITKRHYFGGSDSTHSRYKKFYDYQDKYELNNTLLESFKYLNSDKVLNRYFGAYIAGGQFTSIEDEGPDALSMFWMNRNLRIFRNIQRIKTTGDDRILILFGAGHIAILKWLFECSPEYQVVKFGDVLKSK
ncbi:DUF5694 domain-containing protein [Sediminibacterium salmoneum]|jgi:hypothetical protein|uniref:DUF5694 domain-containing protein n=1 Tax=Sediminibacterium salmoneum TaxID=426421 RepID=UPI0004B568DC|nr:DUF5694 domain-containing protein [Sediminibacterium salmoneum]